MLDYFPDILPKLKERCQLNLAKIRELANEYDIPFSKDEAAIDIFTNGIIPLPCYLITSDGYKVVLLDTGSGKIHIQYDDREKVS